MYDQPQYIPYSKRMLLKSNVNFFFFNFIYITIQFPPLHLSSLEEFICIELDFNY